METERQRQQRQCMYKSRKEIMSSQLKCAPKFHFLAAFYCVVSSWSACRQNTKQKTNRSPIDDSRQCLVNIYCKMCQIIPDLVFAHSIAYFVLISHVLVLDRLSGKCNYLLLFFQYDLEFAIAIRTAICIAMIGRSYERNRQTSFLNGN